MNTLKGKIAIVTGASRGIGLAVAELFNQEKASLVLTARQDLEAINCFAGAKIIKLDLSSEHDISVLISEALKAFGRIDILVNNAATFRQADFESITTSELDEMISIDFKGPFLLLQKVFSQMKKQGSGKIINISSGAGKLGSSKAVDYAACKAALISLTKSLAKLGGHHNINVNAVAPGFIETDMIRVLLKEKQQVIESFIPMKRIGKPSEVASVVRFLSSAEADYITGQTFCVDGGHCMI
jgi:3-oxoacyl-[acyl-carrier protein] reductase